MMSVRNLKILIYIEMFLLGVMVGYGIFVLHWFKDYVAPAINQQQQVQVTNITTEGGYTCYTIIDQRSKKPTKTACQKQ